MRLDADETRVRVFALLPAPEFLERARECRFVFQYMWTSRTMKQMVAGVAKSERPVLDGVSLSL